MKPLSEERFDGRNYYIPFCCFALFLSGAYMLIAASSFELPFACMYVLLLSQFANLLSSCPYHDQQTRQLPNFQPTHQSTNDRCPIIEDTPLVWTLKTPKAASSTLQDLIVGLSKQHPGRYAVNTRQLRVDPAATSTPSKPQGKDEMLQRYEGASCHRGAWVEEKGCARVNFKFENVLSRLS